MATIEKIGLFELVAGIMVTVATFLLFQTNFSLPGWYFSVNNALIAHFALVPAVLAAGWVACALKVLFVKSWLVGAAIAGVVTFGLAIGTVVSNQFGWPVNAVLVAGIVEGMLAGIWLADMFGVLHHARLLPTLAAETWAMLVSILFLQGILPYLLPMFLAALVATPIISAAMSRKLDVPNEKVALPWLVAGWTLLPLVTAIGMIAARLVLPL